MRGSLTTIAVLALLVGAGCSGSASRPLDSPAPLEVDCGKTALGESVQCVLSISNDQDAPVRLSNVAWTGSAPSAFALLSVPSEIAPGEAGELRLTFAPALLGISTARLELDVENSRWPKLVVDVQGEGIASQRECLAPMPSALDFGPVALACESRQLSLMLRNECAFAVSVDSSDGDATANGVRLNDRPVWPATMKSGETIEMKVSWRGNSTDVALQSELQFRAAQLTAPVRVPVRGSVVPPGSLQTDTFKIPEAKMDILFVIDDSTSMADKAASLAQNLEGFARSLSNHESAFRVAVTTTSVCDGYPQCAPGQEGLANGRFLPLQGGPRVLDRHTPDLEAALARNFNVGSAGSDTTRALRAAELALSDDLLAGHNQGFLREDAELAIVVITDGVDDDAMPISHYSNGFISIKPGKPNQVSLSAVLPTREAAPSGCSYDRADAGQTSRLGEAVASLGGFKEEICAPDWGRALERLFPIYWGYRTRFHLANLPDLSVLPEPLTVAIDGVEVPRIGPYDEQRWAYNPAEIAVDFEPLAAPRAGSTLTVSYHVLDCSR